MFAETKVMFAEIKKMLPKSGFINYFGKLRGKL
jgi:hypothetical protein